MSTGSGEFKRKTSVFRHAVSRAKGARFPPEANRYVLYVSYACPWACRCLAVIALKGLGHVMQNVVVEPVWGATPNASLEDEGWVMGGGSDPVFGARSIGEIYDRCTPEGAEPTGIYSVPLFLDAKTGAIVNNESSEIMRFLGQEFNAFAKRPEVDVYPEPFRAEIDRIGEGFYNSVNNGVYRCGFAQSQSAYDTAVTELFTKLDELDSLLARQRFLVAGTAAPTEADVRLFVTLVRFDEVYVVHFKTNKKMIHEYEHLHGWLRDMWQWDGGILQSTVRMDHIKQHYYGSHKQLNPFGIIPVGPDALRRLAAPHGREQLTAGHAVG